MMGDTLHLLSAKWRDLRYTLTRSGSHPVLRALVFLTIGAVLWAFIFGATYWFVDQCQRVEIFGDLLVEKFLATVLLIVFAILFFSNLVASFSTYFLAEDLSLLIPRPVPPVPLYTARFSELLLQSSWMAALFSFPVFLAIGLVYKAGFTFYLNLVALLLPLPVIATALATIICLLLTNLLPARRTRELLALLIALLFVIVFVIFRSLQPERFLNPDERATLIEVMGAFDGPDLWFLPSAWVHQGLWPSIVRQGGPSAVHLYSLYSTAAGLFILGAWTFRSLHFGGFSKAAQGRREGSAPERLARMIFARRHTPAQRGLATLEGMSGDRSRLGFMRGMWRKDIRSFVRDTAQWTQMILLVALVVIYLLNFRYIRSIGEGGIIGPTGLYFANLALASFVITALSVRFVFPMVSLEGRSFWLIRTAPVRSLDFLWAKWRAGAVVIWFFGQLLILASNLMIGVRPALGLAAVIFLTPATVGVVGLGVALGAIYPRFNANNAAQIATGFGGFFYMVVGVAMNLLVVILSIPPTLWLIHFLDGRHDPRHGSGQAFLAAALSVVALVLPLVVSSVTVRLAARRLDETQ